MVDGTSATGMDMLDAAGFATAMEVASVDIDLSSRIYSYLDTSTGISVQTLTTVFILYLDNLIVFGCHQAARSVYQKPSALMDFTSQLLKCNL